MKFKCNTKELVETLNIVSKIASSKTTMPILEGVLIEAYDNTIKFTTYDLKMGCTHYINCEIEEEGNTVVDIKMLNEIIRKLETQTIDIISNDNIFTIKTAKGVFKLSVMDPIDFPKLPTFEIQNSIYFDINIFKDMIKKTLFCVSMDESKGVYTGALLKCENNVLTIVSLDGVRLALKTCIVNKKINDFKAIIPGRTLAELLRILSDKEEGNIKIGTNKNQALFEINNTLLISRILEGQFLDYNSTIPSNPTTNVKVSKKELLDSFERVALFTKDLTDKDKKHSVKMKIDLEGILLSCTGGAGDAKERMSAILNGNELELAFNPRLFIDCLKVIEDEELILEFTTSVSPAVIKSINRKDYIYVVLPVRMN